MENSEFSELEINKSGEKWVRKDADHSKCSASTGIHDATTFGRGELDKHGFWEYPCYHCARAFEKKAPEYGDCWPHTQEQLKGLNIKNVPERER